MASLTCEGYRPLERADAVLEAEQVEARAGASTVGQDGLAGWRPSERPDGQPTFQTINTKHRRIGVQRFMSNCRSRRSERGYKEGK